MLLTALTHLLLVNPKSLELVKQEIGKQAATTTGLGFEALAKLKYMNACTSTQTRPATVGTSADGGCTRWL